MSPTASIRQFVLTALIASTVLVAGGQSSASADPSTAADHADPLVAASAGISASAGLGYTPLNPVRILDTREGVGAPRDKIGPTDFISLRTLGKGGVPSDGVDSVVLNVTAVAPTAPVSFLTVWPRGGVRPDASSLNFVAGQTVPNLVIAKVGDAGQVNIYNESGEVHVLADIVGYYADTSDFTGLTPTRALDTRRGTGAPTGKVGPGGVIDLQVTGRNGVPTTDVGAVVMNVTATKPDRASFVTVWPKGGSQPLASNVNFGPNQNVPNLVIVKVGAGGQVSLANEFGNVHLIADVVGYFLDGASYVGVTPTRILNTRAGVGAPTGKIGPKGQIELDVLGVGGVPAADVRAVVLNMTAAAPTRRSYITVWPGGDLKPTASSLNMVGGRNVANLVIAKVGLTGTVMIENNAGFTHVIADVVGYIDATAGVDLPTDLNVPATNDWSAVNWTVNSATLREQDRASGDFRIDNYDTPFILDMRVRATNLANDSQRFTPELFSAFAGGRELPLIDASFFTLSLSESESEDIELAIAVDWIDDLSDLQLRFGGPTYEPGTVDLVGAQSGGREARDVGATISGTSVNGICTNGGQTVQYQTTSAVWSNDLNPAFDSNGLNPVVYRAPAGFRWLEVTFALDGSNCSSANVSTGDFQVDVDNEFAEPHTFINDLIGTSFDTNVTVISAHLVPLDAQSVEIVVSGSSPQSVPLGELR